jgi:ATP-dependent exoDNAse (exonuclease V) alpha subunit
MAIYHLNMKTFGRNGGHLGSRATSGAAYRAGERIRDERTGAVYDHSARQDVMHKEIVLPAQLAGAGAELDWARNRAALWNAAEHAESRSNARVAREYTVAVPHELVHGQRLDLVRAFAQDLADRYHNAVDFVIHAPRGDARAYHAHLLTTTREITSEGFGPKTTLELSGSERHRRGLSSSRDELVGIRERWATLTNSALEAANVNERVSHLSLAAQGIDRLPQPSVPLIALKIEQRGERSFVAESIRERHKAQLELEGKASPQAAREAPLLKEPIRAQGELSSLEQVRARARENWLAVRRREAEATSRGLAEVPNAATERSERAEPRMRKGADDDFNP